MKKQDLYPEDTDPKEEIPKRDRDSLVRTYVKNEEFPVSGYHLDFAKLYMNIVRWQWHEEVEFFLIESGEACLKLPDRRIMLHRGDGAFINQNQLHSIHSVGEHFCTARVLKFHPSLLFGYGHTQLSVKYLTPVLSSPALHYLPLKQDDPEVLPVLRLIEAGVSCCIRGDFGYELEAKSLLCQLWYELLVLFRIDRLGVAPQQPQSNVDSERTKRAILFIEEKHMEPITLEEIADSIHVSKSECCRCFQRALGLTPFENLMKYRIFESTRKMMRGSAEADSIADLAASVGFNSPSYYNKLFRKYLNCTPTEYKKTLQNGNAFASEFSPE